MAEVWKLIPGFNDNYEVSNEGRVRSLAKTKKYGIEPKVLEIRKRLGNPNVNLFEGKKLAPRPVKDLVYAAFIGKAPAKIRHIDGDRGNCRADNLTTCDGCNDCSRCKICAFRHLEKHSADGSYVRGYRCLDTVAKEYGITFEEILKWVDNQTITPDNCYITNAENENAPKKAINVILLNEDLEFVGEYKTITAASKVLGVTREAVASCLRPNNNHYAVNGLYVVSGTKEQFENNELDTKSIEDRIQRKHKKIVCYNSDGTLKAVYNSLTEASQLSGVTISAITHYINHRKMSKKKEFWRKVSSNEILPVITVEEEKGKYDSTLRNAPVIQMSLTNELIATYENAKVAAEALGINRGCVVNCCKGRIKTCGGYHWCYKSEWEKNNETVGTLIPLAVNKIKDNKGV